MRLEIESVCVYVPCYLNYKCAAQAMAMKMKHEMIFLCDISDLSEGKLQGQCGLTFKMFIILKNKEKIHQFFV
jgi:hypothetical protein